MSRSTVLVAVDGGSGGAVALDQVEALCAELREDGHAVVRAHTAEDALALTQSRADLAAALVSWNLDAPESVLRALMGRFTKLPVFLVTTATSVDDLPLWVSEAVSGYVWLLEDTPDFIAGRIGVAADRYLDGVLPPFFRELRRFEDTHEYSWHTPAHAGGVAFLKSPAGRAFFDYYGERLFRTDLSISVAELGSLFEHTGPIGDAERNAARVFGADLTYFVLHGDSTADRIACHSSIATDELVLVDRNCHKAIYHGLTLTGGRPVYLVPTRNGYGLMGPIPPAAMRADAVAEAVRRSPFAGGAADSQPVYAVITNSTYDGLCYDAVRVAELLGGTVPRLHLDEAWFAYARFNPLYARRYGMSVGAEALPDDVRPTVFSTQSTHKLLAAMSQSSMVHVKNSPRSPVEHRQFNETFMMHATTSPLYPMIAGLDVAAAMMDGPGGRWLTDEAITEAIRFRQAVARLGRRIRDAGDRPDWFFGTWQPGEVTDPVTGAVHAFADAPLDLLRTSAECWTLAPGAEWHGFEGMEDGFCLLDPVKVTITCPGVDALGHVGGDGDSRAGADDVPGGARDRGGEDRRVHVPDLVLDGHHQGQVGHAAGRVAGLQGAVRPRCRGGGGAAGVGAAAPGPVCRVVVARVVRADAHAVEQERADSVAGRGVHPPDAGGRHSGAGLPAVDPGRDGVGAAGRDRRAHGGDDGGHDAAGDSGADAGGERRGGGGAGVAVPAGPGGVRPRVPRVPERNPRRPPRHFGLVLDFLPPLTRHPNPATECRPARARGPHHRSGSPTRGGSLKRVTGGFG